MELQQLRCVIAIDDHGTFTAAATALHISQPALSHAVARLERELGARLFERSAARTRLTEAGKAFLPPARRALSEAESSRAAVDAVAGVLSGELRVMGVQSAVVETARLVMEFHRRHPGIHVAIDEPAGDRGVIDAVRSARCDIGIVHASETPTDLPGAAAGAQDIVAIFPDRLAPPTETVTVEYLSDLPFIAPLTGSDARAAYDAFFRGRARQPPAVAECSNHAAVIEFVCSGMGVAIMSESAVNAYKVDGLTIRAIGPRIRTELTAIRRSEASPAVDAFCHMLVSISPTFVQ